MSLSSLSTHETYSKLNASNASATFDSLFWATLFVLGALLFIVMQPSLPLAMAIGGCLAFVQLLLSNMNLHATKLLTFSAKIGGAVCVSCLLYCALLIAHIFLGSFNIVVVSVAAASLFAGLVVLDVVTSVIMQFILPARVGAAIRCANQIDVKYGGLLGSVK